MRKLWTAGFLAVLILPSAQADYKAGVSTRRFTVAQPYNWRGAQTHALVTTIWYPAAPASVEQPQWIGAPNSPLFSAGKASPDAAFATAPGRFPLILLSHGTGGSALMMGWLGSFLASHGYIAAAVNHPGNNGTEPYTPAGFTLWWGGATGLRPAIEPCVAASSCRG